MAFGDNAERGFLMTDVKGRWTLITGSSRGIGKEIAKIMAQNGSNLILHSRKKESTNILASELISQNGIKVIQVEAILENTNQVKEMLKEIDNYNINLEIVFNNAGIQIGYREDLYNTPLDDFTASYDVNLIAPMIICYHYMPKMIENGFGRIII